MFNKIKEKIKKGWEWIKSRIKKILISLGFIGIAMAAGTTAIPQQTLLQNVDIPAEVQEANKKYDWNSFTIPVKGDITVKDSWLIKEKKELVKADVFATEFYGAWIAYLDSDKKFKPINTDFVEIATGFVVDQVPFTVVVPKQSTGKAIFTSNNRWDIFNKKTIDDPPIAQTIETIGVATVQGRIETGDLGYGPANYVVYPQAYPQYDADLIYYVHFGSAPRLQKLIRFNSLEKAPQEDTVFAFRMEYDKPVYIQRDVNGRNVGWTRKKPIMIEKGTGVTVKSTGSRVKNSDSMRGSGLEPSNIWDSAGHKESIDVRITSLSKTEDVFILSKIIPAGFFGEATFPVFTDDTLTVYPVAGANTPVDGYVGRRDVDETWAAIISGVGTHAYASDTTNFGFEIESKASTTNFARNTRSIVLFDTSALTVNAVISATVLSFYGSDKQTSFYTLDPTIDIYTSSPANTNNVVTGDYGQIQAVSQTGSPMAYSVWAVGFYNDFTFNATGRGNVSLDSISKFGTRNADYDVTGTKPDQDGTIKYVYVVYYAADYGSNKPKLVVTYTLPTVRRIIITQ